MSEEDLKQEAPATEESEVEIELPETENQSDSDSSQQQASETEQVAQSSEDEHEQYSKNVQKRIKKLTEKYRQEERDKEEAARLAQVLREENEKLKSQIGSTQQAHLSEYGNRLESQLVQARQAHRDAHESGDYDKIFEAQQALSKITIEQERFRLATERQERVKVQGSEQDERVQQPVQRAESETQASEPDPKAQDWATKNEWFGQDEIMTYAAFGIHRKLVEEEGFDPTSDEYYHEIDKRITAEFPHKFKSQKGRSSQVASADTSASRRPSGRRTVKLSPSQVAMARKLNVPLEEYAKYVKD